MLPSSSGAWVSDVWTIRSYLNTDSPALSTLWSEHHSIFGSTSCCPVSVWDQCVLSKPFFRNDSLALAIDARKTPVGFVHFGFGSNPGGNRISDAQGIIHKICVTNLPGEEAIGELLMSYAMQSLRSQGATSCMALGTTERNAFYLGVADCDNLMGVLARDVRTQRWLTQAGFQATRPTECWQLDLSSFRPPMDRTQIGIRRTCTVGRLIDEEAGNSWWLSSVLGHCEQTRFNLVLRSPPRVENEILFWYPDPTIAGVDSSIVRLWMPNVPETEEARERFVYLMAESLRQMQLDRKQVVRAFASADQQATVTLFQRLGFRSIEHGMVFAKEF
jgi:hypothetical protein